jgi:phenylalanyl-tRNA synthetase alpha chain
MLDRIKALQEEISAITASTVDEIDELRIKYISKKGKVNQLFA